MVCNLKYITIMGLNMIDENEVKLKNKILELVEQYSNQFYNKKEFIPGQTTIPPSGKLIGSEEMCGIVESALDGWLTAGKFNLAFEKKMRKFLDVKHVLTVNSGSSANLIAFNAITSKRLGDRAVKPGDEIISVAAGFPTTVNPIIQFGAIPVFVDVSLDNYNIDCNKVYDAITTKTKAIMLAHTLGNPFNVELIKKICDEKNLWLIEDTCDALGSTFKGQKVGTFGDLGTLSFYPAHHITMGEGGAVFTNNDELKIIAESIRDWGRDCYCLPGKDNTCGKRFCQKLGQLPYGYDHKYTYGHIGYNLKITDMQAACGFEQLKKIDKFIEARQFNFKYLYDGLSNLQNDIILPKATENSVPSWFGFPISIKSESKFKRTEVIEQLDKKKIGTRLLFAGNLTRQPSMEGVNYRIASDLVNTDFIMNNTFWIGLQPNLNKKMLDYVIENFQSIFK